MRRSFIRPAFTLIELLVVITIISVLAVMVVLSVRNARIRALDTKVKNDMRGLQTAIQQYNVNRGGIPRDNCLGNAALVETSACYNTILGQLVTAGNLGEVPRSPRPSNPYYYFAYGPSTSLPELSNTVVFATLLSTAPESTRGEGNSCRPWAAVSTNKNYFCSKGSNQWYCLCTKY